MLWLTEDSFLHCTQTIDLLQTAVTLAGHHIALLHHSLPCPYASPPGHQHTPLKSHAVTPNGTLRTATHMALPGCCLSSE